MHECLHYVLLLFLGHIEIYFIQDFFVIYLKVYICHVMIYFLITFNPNKISHVLLFQDFCGKYLQFGMYPTWCLYLSDKRWRISLTTPSQLILRSGAAGDYATICLFCTFSAPL